ncbi:MAG: ornithine--oxo-acid transaminase [Anaerolineae bacterium]
MRTEDYIAIEDRYSARNYKPLDVVLERGEGVWLYDVEGRRYMDFLAAYSAANQGHCHPRIVKALQEQAQRLALPSRAFRNDQYPLFARELCELVSYDMVLPMNTGAEAVETAIKAARKWGYTVKGIPEDQAEIVVCTDNFHGRTTTIVSFSSEAQYRYCFGPCTPGFVVVPYGNAEALARAITPRTAAFLVEPIQGEAGVVIPPSGYLAQARELCTQHNVLLIADEIQSGLGRTGKLLASEHEGVRPDVVLLGKALSGGLYPVSAVVADRQVLEVFQPGDHGSTYGGNPLGCAVAREALRVLVDENLIQRSAELGDYMMRALERIHSPHIAGLRGKGLWIGLVLRREAGGARRYTEALLARGLLCKETHDHVIRLSPPLVITREQIDWAVEQIAAVLG